MLKQIWEVLNSKIVVLLIAFVLTTVVGAYINDRYQRATWQREKRFELLSRRLDEGTKFIENLSELMNKRFFRLQRLLWIAESGDRSSFNQMWDEYYESVIEWNYKLNTNRNRIERLAGQETAIFFLDFQDETRPQNPESIHGRFKLAHDRLLRVRKSFLANSKNLTETIKEAYAALSRLDIEIDAFILSLNQILIETEEKMEMTS